MLTQLKELDQKRKCHLMNMCVVFQLALKPAVGMLASYIGMPAIISATSKIPAPC